VAGKNPKLDTAIRMQPEIAAFLRQATSVKSSFEEMQTQLKTIAERL
jgi:flagellar biosynthesis/type III secretory pathway ATPase